MIWCTKCHFEKKNPSNLVENIIFFNFLVYFWNTKVEILSGSDRYSADYLPEVFDRNTEMKELEPSIVFSIQLDTYFTKWTDGMTPQKCQIFISSRNLKIRDFEWWVNNGRIISELLCNKSEKQNLWMGVPTCVFNEGSKTETIDLKQFSYETSNISFWNQNHYIFSNCILLSYTTDYTVHNTVCTRSKFYFNHFNDIYYISLSMLSRELGNYYITPPYSLILVPCIPQTCSNVRFPFY